MDTPDQQSPRTAISSQTYVSAGMLVVILGAAWAILGQISDLKSTTAGIGWDVSDLKKRMTQREEAKPNSETWTDRDMLQWAVKLQRDNPTLKVPEPPMHIQGQP